MWPKRNAVKLNVKHKSYDRTGYNWREGAAQEENTRGGAKRLLRPLSLEVCDSAPTAQEDSTPLTVKTRERMCENKALLDILQQNSGMSCAAPSPDCRGRWRAQRRKERRYRCILHTIYYLSCQCEQLNLKVRTLQLNWETEQRRSMSYFNQIMELERETRECVFQLDQREPAQPEQPRYIVVWDNVSFHRAALVREWFTNNPRFSNIFLPAYSSFYNPIEEFFRHGGGKFSTVKISEQSEDLYCLPSEENLLTLECNIENDISRLLSFPFPPCVNSINRRVNIEFDLNSWGSDENETNTEDSDLCLLSSWSSLLSQLFSTDLNMTLTLHDPKPSSSSSSSSLVLSPVVSSSPKSISLADDITIVAGNRTGMFVQSVRVGSHVEQCGLREGSELLELDQVMFGDGQSVYSRSGSFLSLCSGGLNQTHSYTHTTRKVNTLYWPNVILYYIILLSLSAYSALLDELLSLSFTGADSFCVRVNLDLCSHGDPPYLEFSVTMCFMSPTQHITANISGAVSAWTNIQLHHWRPERCLITTGTL
ncbi:uncharacterized protein LOC127451467 [Myxocyprinus asiaticus]|uniref:uncharacterized protein LOC127451467 n=1 Tax=Myxocyprinus asiaticus TaxID=70543 RepID=UPI002223A0EB|nr:uncharacterized protein LOC127451467 [Myxocyprinus asiaticus]